MVDVAVVWAVDVVVTVETAVAVVAVATDLLVSPALPPPSDLFSPYESIIT